MRFNQAPPALLSLLLATITAQVAANPLPTALLYDLGLTFLMPRQCASFCGADKQFCCNAQEQCYTVEGNRATCSTPPAAAATQAGGGGGYAVYTFTYTETDLVTRTTTSTSWWAAPPSTVYIPAPAPTVAETPAICDTSIGQSSCGIICCDSTQRCKVSGECEIRPTSTFIGFQPVPQPTSPGTFSAPYRPTSSGVLTVTNTQAPTTTAPFLAPATVSGSTLPSAFPVEGGGGLSAGAIAGIVIGVIAGLLLLLLICFCCCVKAGFDGLLALFGMGKRKRRSTEKIETVEHYSRHGSHAGSRPGGVGGWFGGPARVDSSRKNKSSGLGGIGAVGAGLAGLALALGLKRREDKKARPARSDISSSYYTDSYTGTSASK
jgi:hypothetical protein